MLPADVLRHRREFLRAVANHNYDFDPEKGLYLFPKQKLSIHGHFESWVNGKDHDVAPNIIPTEGLNYLLTAGVLNGSAVGTWYVAPFKGNVTPGATLTAATYTATTTEATEYAETTRVAFVGSAAASGSTSNSASKAAFTANASITVYGAGMLSASAKSSTSGTCLAAAKFSASRALVSADVLSVQYTLSATSS